MPTSSSSIASSTRIPSTVGRIGLSQVFDWHGGYLPSAQIQQHGKRIDAVWGSVQPRNWTAVHPGIVVSDYFIMGLDQYSVLHHTLSWWQQNHPSWILYACDSGGRPTHDIAFMGGIDVPDVPLDIHNPSVVGYQIAAMSAYAKSAGYNALAIDQVIFENIYMGGNPNFGQHENNREYGCGVWQGSTFVRHYASPKDPQYPIDVVQYVHLARGVAHSYGMTLAINHNAGDIRQPLEQQLVTNADIVQDETGFSFYGRYKSSNGATFRGELPFVRYAQEHGTAVIVIDKFINETAVDPISLEYSIATYLLGNEGALLLFVGHAYGTMDYYPQYDAPIGRACSAVSGGPPYARRFSGGLVVVNPGVNPARIALPAAGYRDIVGRPVSGSTLSLGPNDAYVLLSNTASC